MFTFSLVLYFAVILITFRVDITFYGTNNILQYTERSNLSLWIPLPYGHLELLRREFMKFWQNPQTFS